MSRKQITYINNSEDEQLYDIAQSTLQKVLSGFIMPNYEVSQKKYYDFGQIVLSMGNSSARNFETSGSINNISYDGEYYYSEIVTDRKIFGTNINTGIDSINGLSFVLKSINDNDINNIQIEYDGDWYTPFDEIDGVILQKTVDQQGEYHYNLKIQQNENGKRMIRFSGYDYYKPSIKFYQLVDLQNNKGILVSKNKNWYFMLMRNIDNVCVRYGKMKFVNGGKTIWGICPKNTPWETLYRGYSNIRCGTSRNKVEELGFDVKTFKGFKWSICSTNSPFSTDKRIKKIVPGGTSMYIDDNSYPTKYCYVITKNQDYRKFILWKDVAYYDESEWVYLKRVFVRYMSLEEVYDIRRGIKE